MELTAQAHSGGDERPGGRGRRWGRAPGSRRVLTAQRAETEGAAVGVVTTPEVEALWDRHGGPAYALACALLGDEVAAAEAVRLAMADLSCSSRGVSTGEARRYLALRVYRHAQQSAGEPSGAVRLPPVMVWLSQLARLQRESLALCVFGGLTYREAADLLDVPPGTVADLLTAGLLELGRVAAGATAACV